MRAVLASYKGFMMNLQIHAKDLTLSDATKAHMESAVKVFKKYSLDITSTTCRLTAQKKGVQVEFELRIAHSEPVIITQEDEVLDAAIDLAIDRTEKALRRLHDKVTSHKKTSIKELETLDA